MAFLPLMTYATLREIMTPSALVLRFEATAIAQEAWLRTAAELESLAVTSILSGLSPSSTFSTCGKYRLTMINARSIFMVIQSPHRTQVLFGCRLFCAGSALVSRSTCLDQTLFFLRIGLLDFRGSVDRFPARNQLPGRSSQFLFERTLGRRIGLPCCP